MRDWLIWFGRWAERDEATKRFVRLQEAFGGVSEQVIAISGRTDLVRRSSGATGRAFAGVEEAFAELTGAFSRLSDVIDAIGTDLSRGRIGPFHQAETELKQVREGLKVLGLRLDDWESLWQEAPAALQSAESAIADLRALAERAGNPSDAMQRIANLEGYLAKARESLAAGNPTEAKAQAADLGLAMAKVGGELAEFLSAASALAEAEVEVERASGSPGHEAAKAALDEAKRYLGAGDLERYGRALFQLREALRRS
jgi:soluble cytochrome b562